MLFLKSPQNSKSTFYRLLKTNKEVHELLLNEYRQYFHVKKNIKILEESEPNITTSNPIKVCYLFVFLI